MNKQSMNNLKNKIHRVNLLMEPYKVSIKQSNLLEIVVKITVISKRRKAVTLRKHLEAIKQVKVLIRTLLNLLNQDKMMMMMMKIKKKKKILKKQINKMKMINQSLYKINQKF